MKRISIPSTEKYLKEELMKWVDYRKRHLTDKDKLENIDEIIQSIQSCLDNEKTRVLIIEWNQLLRRAGEIKKEAKVIDLTFATVFQLD